MSEVNSDRPAPEARYFHLYGESALNQVPILRGPISRRYLGRMCAGVARYKNMCPTRACMTYEQLTDSSLFLLGSALDYTRLSSEPRVQHPGSGRICPVFLAADLGSDQGR